MEFSDARDKFMALYSPCREQLARFARSLTRDEDEARDLEAETILAAFERIDSIQRPEGFKSFLFTIASRKYRRQLRRGRIFRPLSDEDHERPSIETSPDANVDLSLLHSAIQELPTKSAEALVLFEVVGFTLEEIREIQGGSLSGVKMRLTRARQSLARKLGHSM